MRIRSVTAFTLASIMMAVAAFAQATTPRTTPQSAPSIDDWTGLYAGGSVGHVSNTFSGPIDFASVVSGGGTFPAESLDFGAASAGSATIGLQVGYGVRLTRALVGGLEFQLAHSSASIATPAGTVPTNFAFFIPADTRTVATGLMTSIRGRAGTTMMRGLFLYGTIGVAMTKVTATGEFPAVGASFPEANGSDARTMKGLTIGVGGEYAPWRRGSLANLTIGAEFRHAALGTQTFTIANVQVVLPPVTEPAIATVSAHANVFEIRVNYRFPMKKK